MGHRAHLKKIAASLAVVTTLTAVTIVPAMAAETTPVEIGITGVPRTVAISALTFADAALEFSLSSQTVTTVAGTPAELTVTDMSGTGSAWTVYAESTALTSGTDSIPNTAIEVTPALVSSDEGAAVGTGGALGAQQVVMSAVAEGGDGVHIAELDIEITVPAEQHAGTYVGTLTVTETVDVP